MVIVRMLARAVRPAKAALGYIYDYLRFIRYSGWRENFANKDDRNYFVTMIYHGLEKSLSFSSRNPASGWVAAATLVHVLDSARKAKNWGFQDLVAKMVLQRFLEHPDNIQDPRSKDFLNRIESFHTSIDAPVGMECFAEERLLRGKMAQPEDFFFSRYSVREYRDEKVPLETILRAVRLSLKTPSVCNRQAWHVYHTDSEKIKKIALSFQTGNRGFGHQIPNLLIVTADLRAFVPSQERYQHWIDGGMFAMSLVYAFHSLGLVSCCLNWSQTPVADLRIRGALNIDPHHSIIMMLGIGFPRPNNFLCSSARRPIDEFFSELRLKR